MTEFTIRDAAPADHPAIAELVTKAFGRPDEAQIVEKLRADGDIMLELVGDADGALIGHLVFYTLRVLGRLSAMGLGPVSVDPWIQREGVGAALIQNALIFAHHKGEALVFVLGDPKFYERFGFKAETADAFEGPLKGKPEFMAVRLRYGPPMSGKLIFPEAFGLNKTAG